MNAGNCFVRAKKLNPAATNLKMLQLRVSLIQRAPARRDALSFTVGITPGLRMQVNIVEINP